MPSASDRRLKDSARYPQLKRLIIRPGAIGDVIVSLPALEHLRTAYTEVWVPRAVVPLVQCADRVRAISSTGLDLVGLVETTAFDDLAQFDSVVSWYGSANGQFREAVSHLPFDFQQALPGAAPVHAVDYYLLQVGAAPGAMPRIEIRRESDAEPGTPYIAIHPFSGSPKKNWPLKRFEQLARGLQFPSKFCVGPEQQMAGAVFIENLGNLARWLASASLYVGNDSGITHLAAAVGTPVIAIFGPTDPRVWAPRGPAVQVIHNPSIEAITVAEVRSRAAAILAVRD